MGSPQPITDLSPWLDEDHRAALSMLPASRLDSRDVVGSVAALRAGAAERRHRWPLPPLPPTVTLEDRFAPGYNGAPDVPVRLYRPAGQVEAGPAFYWIHGGGMVMGDIAVSDAYCAGIAEELGILVASVEYRLAPEHPYPAPLEDCYAGLHWLDGEADALHIDRERLAIGGASAGGGLAAGLALFARDLGQVAICFQLLVYPMLDDRNTTPSSHAILDPRAWNRQSNLVGWSAYLGARTGRPEDVPIYASPARATVDQLAGAPPAYLNIGTLDLFLDEDISYAQRLNEAGVPAELHVYPGAFHASVNLVPHAALSQRWQSDERGALRRALRLAAP